MKCNLTNDEFFMTNDSYWQVVAESDDMDRIDSPCLSCSEKQRLECKAALVVTLKSPPPKWDWVEDFANFINNKYNSNGKDLYTWTKSWWNQSSKRHRKS